MIKLVSKLLDNYKFYKWSEERKNHLSPSSKQYKRNISIVPYEANYLCQIESCCKENRLNFEYAINNHSINMYLFKVTLSDGKEISVFPYELKEREIVFKREHKELDGFHSVLEDELVIKLYDISKIYICNNSDDFEVQYVKKPMEGFKAITDERGKLIAHGIEYKLGISQVEEVRNPYMTDFQDCYRHFCTTMECVLFCPGGTDYLESHVNYKKNNGLITRLFRVKAEDHCVQHSGDWWVTNKITVMEEVTKEEIYKYYQENPSLKEKVSDKMELDDEFWNAFLEADTPPYKESI